MNRRLFALCLAAAASVAACSSSHEHSPAAAGIDTSGLRAVRSGNGTSADPPTHSAAPAAAVPDACTLITRTEAQKLLGIKLQPGADTKAGAADGVASCNYNAPVTGPSGQLGVYVQNGEPDALKTDRNLGHVFRTVAGIGDQTLEEPDNGSIFAHRGNLWVFVNVPISTPASVLVAAARIAVGRIPASAH